MGLLGLAVGGIIALWLHQLQIPMIEYSPYYATYIIIAFGGVAGLLLGGLISLRPDHDRLARLAREVTKHRRWMLLVHAESMEQKRAVKRYLHRYSDEIVASL